MNILGTVVAGREGGPDPREGKDRRITTTSLGQVELFQVCDILHTVVLFNCKIAIHNSELYMVYFKLNKIIKQLFLSQIENTMTNQSSGPVLVDAV